MNTFPRWPALKGRLPVPWSVVLVLALGLALGLALFVQGASAGPNTGGDAQIATTAMPGMGMSGMAPMATPAPMPGMVPMATPAPASLQPGLAFAAPTPTGNNLDALMGQMQEMMLSLQKVMGQLERKSLVPTALPTPAPYIDMQAMAAELQEINRLMGPLMLRVQADLQGAPSAEELASVRAQVEQLNARMARLMAQLQAARGQALPSSPVMPMPGMVTPQAPGPAAGEPLNSSQVMMNKLQQLLVQMQDMLQKMQAQQMQSGTMSSSMPSSSGQMGDMGMMGGMATMATPAPMPGMGGMAAMATPAPMPGMSNSTSSMMDNMMTMMNNMMMMMDNMMGMSDM